MRAAILLAGRPGGGWAPTALSRGHRRLLGRLLLALALLALPRLWWGSARWQPVGSISLFQALPSPPDGLFLRAATPAGQALDGVLHLQSWAFGALPPLLRPVPSDAVPGGALLTSGMAPTLRDGVEAAGGSPLLLAPGEEAAVRVAPDTSLWLVRRDALEPRLLVGPGRRGEAVAGVVWAAEPIWSPDGRQVYFLSNRDRGGAAYTVWSVDVRTGHERRVLAPEGRESLYLAGWNDRGELLVGSSRGELRALSGSGRIRVLLHGVQVVAVSPDGRHLLFRRLGPGGQVRPELWAADGEGRQPSRLTGPGTPEPVVRGTWAPGGKRLAYIGYSGAPGGRTALVVLDVSGRHPAGGAAQVFVPPSPALRLDLAQIPVWLDRNRLVVGALDAEKHPSTWIVRVW
ncbi:MAG: hypothetical protein QJR14_10200 [Bacillota bacterium]|nr:hypothetical protein [Bacillota bacterium]